MSTIGIADNINMAIVPLIDPIINRILFDILRS